MLTIVRITGSYYSPTTTTGTSPLYATYGFQPNNLNGTIEVLAKNLAIVVIAFDL
jgi:hypothetical protein